MSQVIVGVRRIGESSEVEVDEEATGAAQTMFVLIDGKEVPGIVQATECETGPGFMQVKITFIADEYRTVDHRHKDRYLATRQAGEHGD